VTNCLSLETDLCRRTKKTIDVIKHHSFGLHLRHFSSRKIKVLTQFDRRGLIIRECILSAVNGVVKAIDSVR
jgi:hypothetical protein